MSFISSVIRSSQEYDLTIGGGAFSGSVSVSQNLQYSLIDILGIYVAGGGVNPGYSRGNTGVVLTVSGSTITGTRGSNSSTVVVRLRVSEYVSSLMAVPVVRGTIVISTSSGFASAVLSRAMDARSVLRFLNFRSLSGEAITENQIECRVYQSAANQVTADTSLWGGYTREVGYEVVYWR